MASSPLHQFLSQARSAALRPTPTPTTPSPTPSPSLIPVLGNPSCDLDSFISATIYSFFRNRFPRTTSTASPRPPLYVRVHVPILNLGGTASSELWRLRPEFGRALRLALVGGRGRGRGRGQGDGTGGGGGGGGGGEEEDAEMERRLLGDLVTISDIRSAPSSPLKGLFSKSTFTTTTTTTTSVSSGGRTPVVLVDHNALAIPTPDLSPSDMSSRVEIVGCIDHHMDESSVPSTASPRMIRTGVGSCTSLVVQYLRDEGFWGDLLGAGDNGDGSAVAAVELARLSLAAILIDTADLTAEGKVSDVDRDVVAFLEGVVVNTSISTSTSTSTTSTDPSKQASSPETTQPRSWSRRAFYSEISTAKANSLSLLSLPEIFERDYKSWCETNASSGEELQLGIASVVKPIGWLREKANADSSLGAERLLEVMMEFARSQGQTQTQTQNQGKREGEGLDLFAVMTTSTSAKGGFQRELILLNTGSKEESRRAVAKFEEMGGRELGLEGWREEAELVDLVRPEEEDGGGDGRRRARGRIWWQRNVSKSRKQVAPLLREAMRSV